MEVAINLGQRGMKRACLGIRHLACIELRSFAAQMNFPNVIAKRNRLIGGRRGRLQKARRANPEHAMAITSKPGGDLLWPLKAKIEIEDRHDDHVVLLLR